MKKVLIWLGVVVAGVLVLDIAFGAGFRQYMKHKSLPGDYEMTDYVISRSSEDILVLGSSVALNSINTQTLEDSLGVTAFNGAANGQAFPFYITMLKAVLERYSPSGIVLGVIPSNFTDTGVGVRYNFLAPYYGLGIADIDGNMTRGDKLQKLLLSSNFYRLNKIWFRILLYNFMSAGIKGENGFVAKPLPPEFPAKGETGEILNMSDERRGELAEFISLCKENGVELTIVLTPRYIGSIEPETGIINDIRKMCETENVRFYDDSQLEPFASDSTLFYDAHHINIDGSKVYTDIIIDRLK